jgi:lysophospholipase L1-like esterase
MDERVVVCFGDSNTHGSPPWAPGAELRPRFGPDVRWPGRLAAVLGPSWRVYEEGLPGRTTVHPDPVDGGHLSGLAALPMVLGSHSPTDRLVIMLGTNDQKARLGVGPGEIATSVGVLVQRARSFCADSGRPIPRIIVVSPAPIIDVPGLDEAFRGAPEKSRRLAAALRETAALLGTDFLDAGEHIAVSEVDGVHLEPDAHAALAEAVGAALADIQAPA